MYPDVVEELQLTCVLADAAEGGFLAYCPELHVFSEGETVVDAKWNLREAVELFLETADQREVKERYRPELVEQLHVA